MPSSREGDRVQAEADSRDEPRERSSLEEAHDELVAQAADMDLRYRRAVADLDNYRKRSQGEIERRVGESRDALLRDWLEVSDSVGRALAAESTGPVSEGLRALRAQIDGILARHGVRQVGAVGDPFDPRYHEAVGVRQTDDVPTGTAVEVVRPGFTVEGRVLRPAQVIVSRAPPGDD